MNRRGAFFLAIGLVLSLGFLPVFGADEKPAIDNLVGQPAELSAWAYAYRADLTVQEKPEACFVLRRLERINRDYRAVSCLLAQDGVREDHFSPAPKGTLQSALIWEGRVQLNRVELQWPKNGPAAPSPEDVEVRVYPSPFGWFGWQADQQVTVKPTISQDGLTWVYEGTDPAKPLPMTNYQPPKDIGIAWGTSGAGNSNEVDMVAVFVRAPEKAKKEAANQQPKFAVPTIRAYGPESWKRMDVEIEWGFKDGTQQADYDGRVEGFFGITGTAAPLPDDTGTTMEGPGSWKSHPGNGTRRGITLPILYVQPAVELVGNLPRFPYGHPRDTRITLWTRSGSFTFLVRDLEKGPILAPDYGFFVTKSGSGKTAREWAAELAASKVESIRQMTREHPEATWEEAMREIKMPLLPRDMVLPPYKQVADPPMQVELPVKQWTDAWRMGSWLLQKGELTYMNLALEAPRPIHDMDMVGLHDASAKWLDGFLQRPGTPADGDFSDGSGNFCLGKLFHNTAIRNPDPAVYPDIDTYELVHNGGTGRILYDLAEHYFLSGDKQWFKKNQWRMQAAAEWIIRQRNLYLNNVPNRADLWVAGLHPPQHIADCAWGQSEWKWYANINAWYYQGLHRFAQAMEEIDPANAGRYFDEAKNYRAALKKAVDRAIILSPVMRVRNGTYRSYIPPIFYIRGPSIGQVTQIAMTDDDWPFELVDSAGIPSPNDIRVDGQLDIYEDVLALNTTYLTGGNRYSYLEEKRKERGLDPKEDWFWGGMSSQLGYSYVADIYLKRDEIPSFLRQFINNYAAFVAPVPEYCFMEHFVNQMDPNVINAIKKGEFRLYLTANGHALAYFMEQFRSLLVWEDGDSLWLAKATPRHWLEQGDTISVKNAPSYFGNLAYEIVSDVDHGKIRATVNMPSRKSPKSVLFWNKAKLAAPIQSVEVNGKPWTDFDKDKELVRLNDLTGKVTVVANY
ncbi:MAG: hypothetical protein M1608_02140 [Candidatus Omnitrophica bacterium]|nr:hypothetical protein [Candidatus Omnitrophota bacterium]